MRIRPPTLSGVAIGALVAVIVTATGATAAALITGADIKNGTVASADLKNNNVASVDIKDGTVASVDIKNGTVASADIADRTIAARDLSTTAVLGTFGPVHLTNLPDTGCATDDSSGEPWARDSMDRSFTVEPAEDGSGFIVTRYDLNGTFTTVTGGQHPGCTDADLFDATPESGTWQGVWTQTVTGNFDYRPNATMPANPTWDAFIAAFFFDPDGGGAPTLETVSYEFDYYLECGPGAPVQHWRDQFYDDLFTAEGNIDDC